jgi:UDP-N-acetylmuramoylalanine--D-glutamate ligase
MGLDNEKIVQHFSPLVANIVQTNSVQEAVMKAKSMAKKGEVVLLSPACASFDLFNNYEHRGDSFKEEVLKLIL